MPTFQRFQTMFDTIRRKIFGVRETPSGPSSPPLFVRETDVHPDAIRGAGPNGECYTPWRTDPTSGEQWFRRISAADAGVEIRAIAPEEDFDDFGLDAESAIDSHLPDYGERLIHSREWADLWEAKRRELGLTADDGGDDDA